MPRLASTSSGGGCMNTWVPSSGSCGERSVQVPPEPASAFATAPWAVPLLTSKTWAKSARTSSSRCTLAGSVCGLRRLSSSTRLPASQRRRTTRTSATWLRSGSPSRAGRTGRLSLTVIRARETVTADSGVGVVELNSSTMPALTVMRSRLRCRMSSYTRPCVAPTMSPASSLMAKLRPSTTTRSWRPPVGTLPAERWCSDIRPLCTMNPQDARPRSHVMCRRY